MTLQLEQTWMNCEYEINSAKSTPHKIQPLAFKWPNISSSDAPGARHAYARREVNVKSQI